MKPTSRAIAILTVALCIAAVLPRASAADRVKPPFPEVGIGRFVRSENAVQALGARMPDIAVYYGKTPNELAKLLRHDPNLWVSPSGRLLYACELETPLAAEMDASTTHAQVLATSFPLEQTFQLHSSPNSPKVIYLDFNGQVVSGTAWNASHFGGAAFTAAPYDIDGSPSTFGTTELQRIQNVWRRVAEDYSMFDVDVTTEEPAADALTRSGSTDTRYGIRVVITPTNFYPNAGGVSYIGVFDETSEYYKISWVFSNMLQNSEKYIGEACAHESGHAVGLHHEGKTDGTVYYQGQGTWAPIMGNSYYKNVTQWARGEYSGANNTEDQLQVILNNGLSYYPDDHGNTAGTATALPATTSLSGSGFIERNTDVDVFRFASGAGAASFTITAAPLGPDLDTRAEIRDGGWNLLASANPPELGATLSATLTAAGTYYLVIGNTGYLDPASTGYSSYASLGQYTFTGTIADPGNLTPPVAAASASVTTGYAPLAVAFSSAGSADANGPISYLWNFGDGSTSSAENPTHTYASAGTFVATLVVADTDGLTASDSVTITVQSAPPPPDPMAPPANLVASAGKAQVTLRWQDKSTAETRFEIERSSNSSFASVQVKTVAANATSGVDTGLTRGSRYYYRVRACNTLTCSGYSNTVAAKPR